MILMWRLIMNRFKRISSFFLLFIALAGVIGCNTIEGMGKDIEKGGEKIQDAVK